MLHVIIGELHCIQITREYQRTVDRNASNLIPDNNNNSNNSKHLTTAAYLGRGGLRLTG